jgi:hypothetical protein
VPVGLVAETAASAGLAAEALAAGAQAEAGKIILFNTF